MEDGKILDLYFARDESAIAHTDGKYGSRVRGVSFAITHDREDTEECVSDTYLAAWNNIPPTRPAYLGAYLYRIARNISYDLVDKRIAVKRRAETLPLTAELMETLAGTGEAGNEELALALNEFLRSLDKGSQMLFIRRYYYGDTIEKLSLLTKMGKNGVSAKLLRIRKKLKSYLAKEGFTI